MKPRKQTTRIVVHHSASPLWTTLADIRRWHKARGFADVGYHWVIDNAGCLFRGRTETSTGAHCISDSANQDSIGICVVGNNSDVSEAQQWTNNQIVTLRGLVADLKLRYPTISTIYGHRDVPGAQTLCPGLDMQYLLKTNKRKP